MQINSILLNKAGQKVELQLDGTKVAILENNNPYIGTLYISDNNTQDEYDIKLKYGEQIVISSTVFMYHTNPQIKGRIKFLYKVTTQPDKILKDFNIGNNSSNEITILEMVDSFKAVNERWTLIETFEEVYNTNRDWVHHGVFTVKENGYYNIKLTIKIDKLGDLRNTFSLRLIEPHLDVIAQVSTSQYDENIFPSLSIDKIIYLERDMMVSIEVFQNAGYDIDIQSKPFDTFGSIELLNIKEYNA